MFLAIRCAGIRACDVDVYTGVEYQGDDLFTSCTLNPQPLDICIATCQKDPSAIGGTRGGSTTSAGGTRGGSEQ